MDLNTPEDVHHLQITAFELLIKIHYYRKIYVRAGPVHEQYDSDPIESSTNIYGYLVKLITAPKIIFIS